MDSEKVTIKRLDIKLQEVLIEKEIQIKQRVQAESEKFKIEYEREKLRHIGKVQNELQDFLGSDIFIVHGQDNEAKEAVARFLENLKLKIRILHEQTNKGRTIIQKFEDYSSVGFAVVLLTPDDIGYPKEKEENKKKRARQNVIFELGYFIGKIGGKRVCALYKEDVEIPSDYQGVMCIKMDKEGAWKVKLAREIKEVGIEIDLNNIK